MTSNARPPIASLPNLSTSGAAAADRLSGVRRMLLALIVCASAFAWMAFSVSALAAQSTGQTRLHITDGQMPVGQLIVGDDLYVGVTGAPPHSQLRLDLIDITQQVVASRFVEVDANGFVEPMPLWYRSGVVGCDANVDPDAYRFRDFDQAEAFLHGVALEVEAREVGVPAVVASEPVQMAADATKDRFYFADGSGCARSEITKEEDLYLAGRGLSTEAGGWTVFLIEGARPAVGAPLDDVRSGSSSGPQWIPGSGPDLLVLLWVDPMPGRYGAVIREGSDSTPIFKADDIWLGDEVIEVEGTSPHGITIRDWPCSPCFTAPTSR